MQSREHLDTLYVKIMAQVNNQLLKQQPLLLLVLLDTAHRKFSGQRTLDVFENLTQLCQTLHLKNPLYFVNLSDQQGHLWLHLGLIELMVEMLLLAFCDLSLES